jgi:MFS family permease
MMERLSIWPRGGLWRHADFLKFWSAQTVSQFGTQISQVALPLVAVIVLDASAFQVAALGTVEFLPFLLFTLPAGVWVDRLPRRPILVIADFGRAAALGSIPVAAAIGHLTLAQLYVAGFVTGSLTVFFDVAYQSYLPSIVERAQFVDGNSKLEVSRSVAQIGGPGFGGLLVRAFSAPYAVLADAVSFLWSASFLFAIRKEEVVPERTSESPSLRRELIDGVRYLLGHRYWRGISMSTATFNFFNNVAFAILIVYLVRRLHMSPLTIGITFSLASAGALLAAFFAGKIGTRLGIGRTILVATIIDGLPLVLVPLAPRSLAIPFIVTAFALVEFGVVLYNVSAISLTQALTPERLLGRVNASRRFIVWGTIPLGSLVSGVLASTIGLRPTMFIGAIGCSLAAIPIALSPVRHVKELPTEAEELPHGEDALFPTEAAGLSPEGPSA